MLDFTLLDKRLGTLQELRDLVNAAHNLGMYVIVDVFASALVASDENLTRVQFSEGQAIVSLGVLAHS
jgi:pullulanase/glycogen debranching enzyme